MTPLGGSAGVCACTAILFAAMYRKERAFCKGPSQKAPEIMVATAGGILRSSVALGRLRKKSIARPEVALQFSCDAVKNTRVQMRAAWLKSLGSRELGEQLCSLIVLMEGTRSHPGPHSGFSLSRTENRNSKSG